MIRRATLNDAPAIAQIHVNTWRVAYAGIVPGDYLAALSEENRAKSWRKQLADGGSVVLVAVEAGIVTGWVSAGPSRDVDKKAELEVYAIYVSPEYWRRSVGRQLMEEIEDELPCGLDISLWVLRENRNARSFYEKIGYCFDGSEKEVQIGAAKLIEMRMRRNRPNKTLQRTPATPASLS